MFKPRLSTQRIRHALSLRTSTARRYMANLPPLDTTTFEHGIPGFLSPAAFHLNWVEGQSLAMENLDYLTAGTQFENQSMLDVVKVAAREPRLAPIFNWASLSYNNHFFFKMLSFSHEVEEVPGNPMGMPIATTIPAEVEKALVDGFGSMETLRLEMYYTAMAMFGPGFVWLVQNKKSMKFRVVPTYLAGSPFAEAHWRRQVADTNSNPEDGQFIAQTQLAQGGVTGAAWGNVAPGGIDAEPLLCVSVWDRMWLMDYGVGRRMVGGGRAEYLKRWWNVINWNSVPWRQFKPGWPKIGGLYA